MGHQVLHAAELLEEIFCHLPQRDLLLVQRVCRTWRGVITSTTRLQAALFFHPGIPAARPTLESPGASKPDINPLLYERFPLFFYGARQKKDLRHDFHNLGPWNSSDWYRGKSTNRFPEHVAMDKQRMAAYAHPHASWRRMIPFRPLPEELQVCLGAVQRSSITGVYKRLTFLNTLDSRPEVQHPWLTFGLLYDIVEEAWFRGAWHYHPNTPIKAEYVQFDFPWVSAGTQGANPQLFNEARRLKRALPDDDIGGERCLLVHLNRVNEWCGTGRQTRVKWEIEQREKLHIFNDEFKSKASCVAEIRWDKIIQIPRRAQQPVPPQAVAGTPQQLGTTNAQHQLMSQRAAQAESIQRARAWLSEHPC